MIQSISFRGDRSPVPPRVKIGFESDNLVESLAFELPELAGDQSSMLMISGNAYANMIDLHRTEDGKWAVDLTAEMVGPAGVHESYVAITCPDGRRWNSGVFDLLTGDLPDISGAIETLYPTAVEHVLQEMAETRQEMAASVTASEDAAQRAEEAAQRAEDAANQGGGGGSTAPAKDAVLYTAQELTEAQKAQARENIGAQPTGEYITAETDPTVPEWAKQPNKPTYTAKEVGALPEDTAIPEPYVLPVATAETLGGVKVGEGLEMNGDVLGVEPAREAEKLYDITLTEDTALVKIALPKKSKHVRVMVYPPEVVERSMYVYVSSDELFDIEHNATAYLVTDVIEITPNNYINGIYRYRYMCDFVCLYGMLFCYWGYCPKEYSTATPFYLNKSMKTPADGLSQIKVMSVVQGMELLSGTRIEVWG